MRKIILCSLFLGFIYIFGTTDAKAQEGCKNYLGRPNQSLCTAKKSYDECVGLLKEGKRDLCLWTGDPMTRIERKTRTEAEESLTNQGCRRDKDDKNAVNCGDSESVTSKAAYNVCIGYKNFGVIRGCTLTISEKTIKAKRSDAFELGVQMGRLMYFAAITEVEIKKNNGTSKEYDKAFKARQNTLGAAEKIIKSINSMMFDKSQNLDENQLWGYSDAKHEANSLTVASQMKMNFGANLTKNYKLLSEAFYLGFDMGAADVIVQNSDTAKRQEAINYLTAAQTKAQSLYIPNGAHPTIISLVKNTNPLVNVYTKVFDLRQWYKEAIAKI